MGLSSWWAVGALSDEEVAELAPVAGPVIREMGESTSARDAWSRWERDAARGDGAVPVWRPDGYNTEEALHLYDMVNASAFDALDGSCALHIMEWWERFDEDVEPSITSVRKDNPVAALFHGLGPRRARVLPGWAGDAVLTAAEVRHHLEAVESVLALSGAERKLVLRRIEDWPGDKEPVGILDHPLRVWRQAAAAGLGLLSCRIWF
ncbi:hypothetical protein [Streptomyces alanosinicus]|uniref:Uncharacterized protein n=1 Tax=Streptomyces alanosinicus TaxID=68171 RepID=A0A919D596_9ACTN|nr:hypothetical protein [Streptomyces alanosinicus]GHE06334.1 hypothetical protein GCM10010339_46180 [Streptomyces alanosinicus]